MSFISGAVGITAHTTTEDYICDTAGQTPLVINLADEFTQDIIDTQKIESITFSIDCKTNLDPERAYLTQGQIYYYTDGEMEYRNFADLISVEDTEYASVQNVDSICTEITVGTEEHPLNCDINNDITFYWTWITPEKLSMYELGVTTTDGMFYKICSEDYYTVEISEEMREDKPQTATTNFMFEGRYCITSIYGYDNDRFHEGLDVVPYDNDTVYSITSGYVEYADWENAYDPYQGFGKYVKVVSDTDEYWYYYGHLDEILVEPGTYVETGQAVGICGNTGSSTGKHTHLSVRNEYGEYNPADILGITNDYGDYEAVTETVISENELAMKCLAINKEFEAGYLGANAIRPNDSGAVALGICQWNGANAKRMLQYLYETNKATYINIAHKYNDGYINYLDKSDSWWSKHYINEGDNEYNFYTELLDNDLMIESQYEYALDYMKTIIEDAQSHGVQDERSIMIFSKCYNVLPYGGVAEKMRRGITDFDDVCSILLEDTNTNRHEEVIAFANSDVEYVTVESLKGER